MMKSNKIILLITFLIFMSFLATGAIFWKAAKDEIFYLCSNFSTGVLESSVIKQLNTANLSNYTHTNNENGSIIVFRSRLYFVANQCIIELDKNGQVVFSDFK